MFRSVLVIAVAAVLGAVAFAAAQTGDHGSHGVDSASAPHRRMHAALEEWNGVIAKGLGAGLAFPADQNSYPGPLHVLEHKEALRLTAEQERRMEALQTAMFAASRPASRRLLEAEGRLRRLFADGIADEPRVRAAVADVERAWTDVRLVHLLTHLQTRLVLTEEQRRNYREIRWGN
jgi:Spy/CpxP family protein refolding chaperone